MLYLLLFLFDPAVIVCFVSVFTLTVSKYQIAHAQIMKKMACLIELHLLETIEFGDDLSLSNSSSSTASDSFLYS